MPRFAAVVLSAAIAWIVACSSGDSSQPPATAQVAEAIQTADFVGSSATGFFPVGFFIDGHQIDQPNGSGMEDNYDAFPGGPPVDPNDALQYYDETFTQMRSLGMNSMVMPNVDVIWGSDGGPAGHLKSIASKASNLGGIYPVPGSQAIQGLTTPTGKFDGDPDFCASRQAGSADEAVKETLVATVESCVDQFGSDTGAFCNKFLCTHSSLYCCPNPQQCVHKASGDALAGFYTLDEPSEPCAPVLREATKRLGLYDPGHSGFASISTVGQTYRGTTFDKMLGDDHVLYDDVWPLVPGVSVGDVLSLETWDNRIDDHYVLAPADKPLYYDIQAASDCCIRKPTPQEIRYLTYAALARGVKGIFFYLYGPQPPFPTQSGGPADTDYNLDATGQELRSLGQSVRTLAPYLIDATRDMPRKNGRSPIATAYRTDGGTGSGGSGYDLDVTSFTTEAGEHEVMLVNERLNPGQGSGGTGSADPASIPFQVSIDPGTASALFAKGAVTVRDVLTNTNVGTFLSGSIVFPSTSVFLKQGEGRLYLLQSDYSATVTIARDAYHNPVAAPKPVKVQVQLKNTGAQNWTTTSTNLGIHVYAPDGTQSDILGLSVGSVNSGNTTTLTVSIPTGAGTSITQSGTYQLGFDLYKVTGTVWFKNEKRISVMVVPPGQQPLLVDTFDRVPFGSSPDTLRKWDRTGLMKIRGDALAVNGGNAAVSHWGSGWGDYTLDFDVMVDVEAQGAGAQAGWIVHATVPNPSSGTATSGYVFELQAQDPAAISTMNVSRVQTDGSLYPVATVPTKIAIGKGTWYHVTQVISSTTVSTHIYQAGFFSQGQDLDNVTINAGSGEVGFYELDPGYVVGSGSDYSCQSSPVGFCSGGSVPGTPCVAAVNCLGGTCAGASDNCYPSLQRGHFDNVFVYRTPLSFTISAPSGLFTTSSTYPLTLSWNRVEPNDAGDAVISHYRVYRSADCNFTPPAGTLVAEPAAALFVDTTPGTYCYKVTAVSFANVEGPASAGAIGTVGTLLSTPTVTATVSDTKSVAVSWTSIASAAKYLVYRGAPGFVPSESTMIATVTVPGSTTYQDAPPNMYVSDTQLGLNSFTTYKYAVVPVAADGVVDASHAGFSSNVTPPSSKIFSDGFDGTAAKWSANSGTWTVASSAYTQSDTACTATNGNCASTIMGASPLLWPTYGDLSIEATFQIIADAGGGYAGVTIRKTHSTDQYGKTGAVSGYLVYMKDDASSTLGIKSPTRGDLLGAVVATGLPMNVAHRLRVDASGQRLRVYVDGYKYIDYYDDTSESMTGYVDLATYKSSVNFFDVNVFFREGFSEITHRADFWSMDCTTMLCDSYSLPGTSTLSKPGNWAVVTASPYAGEWWIANDAGLGTSYLHEDEYPVNNAISTITQTGNRITDADISFTVKITNYRGDVTNWAGVTLRKQSPDSNDRFGNNGTGYLVYYRANGQIQIFNIHDGVMGGGATGYAPPPTTEQRVWIQAQGNTIKVFVGAPTLQEPPSTPTLTITDANSYWSGGYMDFTTYGVAAEFRNLSISRYLPNWRLTSTYGVMDTRWPYQLMLPAPAGVGYSAGPTALKVADFTADFAVRIDAFSNSTGWAAFSFHKTNPTDSIFTSGYMVALKPSNGTLFLYGAPPAPAFGSCTIPTTSYQRIRVTMQGSTIQVWSNGQLCTSATTSTWPSGYVDLTASEVTARYEYLEIY